MSDPPPPATYNNMSNEPPPVYDNTTKQPLPPDGPTGMANPPYPTSNQPNLQSNYPPPNTAYPPPGQTGYSQPPAYTTPYPQQPSDPPPPATYNNMSNEPPPVYDNTTKQPLPPDGPTGMANPPYPTSNQPNLQSNYPPPNTAYPPPGQTGYSQPPAYTTPYPQQPVGMANYNQPTVIHQQPATTNVVITQNAALTSYVYRGFPMQINCPYCHEQITTELSYVNGGLTYLLCGLTALFGCWCGCCLIPFCVDGCKNVQHKCPNCTRIIGVYHRM